MHAELEPEVFVQWQAGMPSTPKFGIHMAPAGTSVIRIDAYQAATLGVEWIQGIREID